MNLGLDSKLALVTGSTAGIGFAIAEALADEGASVIVNGRTQARVDAAMMQLHNAVPNARVEGIAADVSTAAGCSDVIAAFPEIDVLVNNIGIFETKSFQEISDVDWLRYFETNVLSGVRLSRHYVRGMRSRNWGRIVFISSESGVQIPADLIHYGVTKTAQLAVARGLAETLAGTNVTVNSVIPGPTASESLNKFVTQYAQSTGKDVAAIEREFFTSTRPSSIIQRFATTAEVAALVAYICGAQASATTGTALRVDGGVVRTVV